MRLFCGQRSALEALIALQLVTAHLDLQRGRLQVEAAFPPLCYYQSRVSHIFQVELSHLQHHPSKMTDKLTPLPFEILDQIIEQLDSLTIIRCREVSPELKACVDDLPDYQAYRTKFRKIISQFYQSHDKVESMTWSLKRAVELFAAVQAKVDVDCLLFEWLSENWNAKA